MIPLSARLAKAMEFDEMKVRRGIVREYDSCSIHDYQLVRWHHKTLQPFLEVLIELADSVANTYHGSQRKEECSICQSLIKLQTLLDAKEG